MVYGVNTASEGREAADLVTPLVRARPKRTAECDPNRTSLAASPNITNAFLAIVRRRCRVGLTIIPDDCAQACALSRWMVSPKWRFRAPPRPRKGPSPPDTVAEH
jgi:hypothetical protein